jgi:release factor glutamine methyltransferase
LARQLIAIGIRVIGNDSNKIPQDLIHISCSKEELLLHSQLILGCCGANSLSVSDLSKISGTKVFVSCSSSNVEFRSLLNHLILPDPPFGTARGRVGRADCYVLNGGFPINFDRKREWEHFDEIVLTRKLMLEGILQSRELLGSKPCGVMLDPARQLKVVVDWFERVSDPNLLRMPDSLTEDFFRRFSEGEVQMHQKPKYTLHDTTPNALREMRSHKVPYETAVGGVPIIVLPNVWSPAYDWSSLFYIENLPDVTGLSFLEIGCGTGVISVFAARAHASRVVAIDVNPDAVQNTKLNFERYNVTNGDAFLSDCFENIDGTFDLITWNAPYHGCKPVDLLEYGCSDENYLGIRQFFEQAGDYLNIGGRIIFGFSESGDLPLIESLIDQNGYRVVKKLSDWRQDYNCMLFDLVRKGGASIP